MTIPRELIVDRKAFSALREECEKVVNTTKRLPDFVFQRSFAKYFAIEHAHIYSKEFASLLFRVSEIFNDEAVNYMLVDPDPNQFQRDSYFGLASFEPSRLMETYVAAMSGRSVHSLAVRGNVGAFWGSSLKWAVFCDRISWEIAVIAISEDVDVPTISGFRCLNATQIADYIVSQYRIKDPSNSIASEFTRRFLANYPI